MYENNALNDLPPQLKFTGRTGARGAAIVVVVGGRGWPPHAITNWRSSQISWL
jgi:hypothetical protein